jgi:cation diffusion facilitator CzcD-associated flavoprotein CzcO
VAEHLQIYAEKFHLNVILETTIQSTVFSNSKKNWTVEIKSAGSSKTRTIISKHLAQTTGLGSGKPYIPKMESEHLYNGISIHSGHYRNVKGLVDQGVRVRPADPSHPISSFLIAGVLHASFLL